MANSNSVQNLNSAAKKVASKVTTKSSARKRRGASARRAAVGGKSATRRVSARSRANAARLNEVGLNMVEQGKAGLRDAYGRLIDASSNLRNAQMPKLPSQRSLQQMGESPLLIGAVGLGIGVLLGAVIPAVNHIRHR